MCACRDKNDEHISFNCRLRKTSNKHNNNNVKTNFSILMSLGVFHFVQFTSLHRTEGTVTKYAKICFNASCSLGHCATVYKSCLILEFIASQFVCQCHKHIYEHKNSAKKSSAATKDSISSSTRTPVSVFSFEAMKMKSAKRKEQKAQCGHFRRIVYRYKNRLCSNEMLSRLLSFSIDRAQRNEKSKKKKKKWINFRKC